MNSAVFTIWATFNDPVLSEMINDARRQNLTVRQVGYRILQARAQIGIATGKRLPQTHDSFWAKFRQDVESGAAVLDAPAEEFDEIRTIMLRDIVTSYLQLRTVEVQVRLTRESIYFQRRNLEIISSRYLKDKLISEVDYQQQRSIMAQTEALIPELEVQLRQHENMLCILMGIPSQSLREYLGKPATPNECCNSSQNLGVR